MNANQIKVKFIECLIKHNDDIIIGNEVLFSVNNCRADIIMLKKNKIFAYEIKSDSDNFIEFDKQINNYLSTFNYTYVVLTSKHEKQIKSLLNYNIGIYVFSNNKFQLVKRPTLSKQNTKSNLLEFLKKKDLLKLINKNHYSKYSVFELRNIASKNCSIKKIQQYCYNTLKIRYSILYKLFLEDTNKDIITIEDLKSLTGNITSYKLSL